jgi:hypothetical protein
VFIDLLFKTISITPFYVVLCFGRSLAKLASVKLLVNWSSSAVIPGTSYRAMVLLVEIKSSPVSLEQIFVAFADPNTTDFADVTSAMNVRGTRSRCACVSCLSAKKYSPSSQQLQELCTAPNDSALYAPLFSATRTRCEGVATIET